MDGKQFGVFLIGVCFAGVFISAVAQLTRPSAELQRLPTVDGKYLGCDIVRSYDKEMREYYYFPDCRKERSGNVAPMS